MEGAKLTADLALLLAAADVHTGSGYSVRELPPSHTHTHTHTLHNNDLAAA